MKNKLFTIITVTYNAQDSIEGTVKSVINQDFKDYEYIIIDGKSTDDTVNIIRRYNCDKIQLISESDKGIYDAMNKGICMATGRYLYFLQSGDMLLPNVLSRVEKSIKDDKCSLIYGNVYWGSDKKIYDGIFDEYKISIRNICHQAIFYHRRIFEIYKGYNIRYNVLADYELNLKCFANSEIRKKYIDVVIAKYSPGYSLNVIDDYFNGYKQLIFILNNFGIMPFLYSVIFRVLRKIYQLIHS